MQADRQILPEIKSLNDAVRETETRMILKAYQKYGSTMEVAKALGVHQTTILRKIKTLGIENGIKGPPG